VATDFTPQRRAIVVPSRFAHDRLPDIDNDDDNNNNIIVIAPERGIYYDDDVVSVGR